MARRSATRDAAAGDAMPLTFTAAELRVSQAVNYTKHMAIAGVDQGMILSALDSLVATEPAVGHKSMYVPVSESLGAEV